MIKYVGIIFLFFLFTLTLSYADLVQTKRGEFHNGDVQQDLFQLKTEYGLFTFKKSALKRLSFFPNYDELITKAGERLRGKIQETKIKTTRQLGPILDISLTEISFIQFSNAPACSTPKILDAIEMLNGDVLLVNPVSFQIELESFSGVQKFQRDQLKHLDISFSEDQEDYMARLLMKNMGVKKGILRNTSLPVKTINGDHVSISLDHVSLISFDVDFINQISGDMIFPSLYEMPTSIKVFQDQFVDGTWGPAMVRLPEGEYMRGQADGDFDEKPVQKVKIANPFAISRFEITFDDFENYCREVGCDLPDDSDWGRGKRPVINISWDQVEIYLKWLSGKTGARYRLPSDAEWEYAARAGVQSMYAWGDDVGEENANCSGCLTIWGSERTARVGRFPPNAFGLYDMAGNVFEWTQDCWNVNFKDLGLDASSYENPAGCGNRVIRGGGWSFPPKEVRLANRWRDLPSRRSDDTGFRVVRELD